MADNITVPVPDGTTLATKDIGGVHASKIMAVDSTGVDAIGAVDTSPAANTILGRLKAIADALLGTIGISATALPLPAGAATSAKQDDIIAAIGTAPYYPVTQPVSGTVGISGEVAVTGTFYQETQPVSLATVPLPTGAATSAKQDAVKASIDATSLTDIPFPITPGSSALSRQIKAIAIAVGGDVVFTPAGGGADVTVTLPAGMFPLPATHILSGTTATGLTGF